MANAGFGLPGPDPLCLDHRDLVIGSAMTNNGLGITALAFAPNSLTLFAGDQGGIITPGCPRQEDPHKLARSHRPGLVFGLHR